MIFSKLEELGELVNVGDPIKDVHDSVRMNRTPSLVGRQR
jgi:hypothetical protein